MNINVGGLYFLFEEASCTINVREISSLGPFDGGLNVKMYIEVPDSILKKSCNIPLKYFVSSIVYSLTHYLANYAHDVRVE